MGAPTVYRFDDTDAPVLDGIAGSLVNLLDKVLVTGYGAKAALGWTKDFTDGPGTAAIFRNNQLTGTGFFLEINETILDGRFAVPRLWEAPTGIGAGTGPAPNLDTNHTVTKSSTTTTQARPWMVIGDDRCFYLYTWPSSVAAIAQDYALCYFFGDGVADASTDTYCFLQIAFSGTSTAYGPHIGVLSTPTASNTNGYTALRSMDGAVFAPGFSQVGGSGPTAAHMGANGPAYPFDGKLLWSTPTISNGINYSHRGRLPGLHYPCHPLPFTQLQEVTADGYTLLAILFKSYTTNAQCLIDLGTTFRP